jgi:excisionase family DNA binding protein
MAEGRIEGDRRAELVTVSQAARILRVHRNTVHNYIKQGRIKASKTIEGGREYYLIEWESLPNVQKGKHEHTLDAQPPAERTEIAVMLAHRLEDLVQRYGQELGSVREELGAERVRREQAEEKAARLEAELEVLRETRDAPEAPPRRPPRVASGTQGTPTSDTDEPRRSWLYRFFFGP